MRLRAYVLSTGDLLVGEYSESGVTGQPMLSRPVLVKHVSTVVPKQTKIVGQIEPVGVVIKVYGWLGIETMQITQPTVGHAEVVEGSPIYAEYSRIFATSQEKVNA